MNKEQQYARLIVEAVGEIIEERDGLNPKDANAFFTGFFLAFGTVYRELTQEENKDLIDIVALANRLVFQYLKGGK